MATRIIVGLAALASIVEGLAPGAVPQNLLPLALVILGLVYGAMVVDAEDATGFLAVTIAVGAAAGADVLGNIPMIGAYLDAILDQQATALYGAVGAILVVRVWNRLKSE